MQLFYAPDIAPPEYTLGEEESKHCVRVLRLGRGERIHITDGRGNLHACEIVDDDARRCKVRIAETHSGYGRLPYDLTMAVAPTKNADRFEWFLEKATEVGVTEIVPIASARSERRSYKSERGQKVVTAAMKQSLKAYRPLLRELTPFGEAIARPFEGRRFIAHCDAPQSEAGRRFLPSLLHRGEHVQILIGPEGDFSPEEIRQALACGFEEISLGTQRLRTETAAVVAAVLVAAANGPE